MTEIQLLLVTETLQQLGDQVVKAEVKGIGCFDIFIDSGLRVRVWSNGDREWWLNGQRHRTDGPAVEYANGAKEWYLNGQYHRTDGPAVECANGDKDWYLNGIQQLGPTND